MDKAEGSLQKLPVKAQATAKIMMQVLGRELLLTECAVRVRDINFHPKRKVIQPSQPIFHVFAKINTSEFKSEIGGNAGRTGTLQLGCRVVQ